MSSRNDPNRFWHCNFVVSTTVQNSSWEKGPWDWEAITPFIDLSKAKVNLALALTSSSLLLVISRLLDSLSSESTNTAEQLTINEFIGIPALVRASEVPLIQAARRLPSSCNSCTVIVIWVRGNKLNWITLSNVCFRTNSISLCSGDAFSERYCGLDSKNLLENNNGWTNEILVDRILALKLYLVVLAWILPRSDRILQLAQQYHLDTC